VKRESLFFFRVVKTKTSMVKYSRKKSKLKSFQKSKTKQQKSKTKQQKTKCRTKTRQPKYDNYGMIKLFGNYLSDYDYFLKVIYLIINLILKTISDILYKDGIKNFNDKFINHIGNNIFFTFSELQILINDFKILCNQHNHNIIATAIEKAHLFLNEVSLFHEKEEYNTRNLTYNILSTNFGSFDANDDGIVYITKIQTLINELHPFTVTKWIIKIEPDKIDKEVKQRYKNEVLMELVIYMCFQLLVNIDKQYSFEYNTERKQFCLTDKETEQCKELSQCCDLIDTCTLACRNYDNNNNNKVNKKYEMFQKYLSLIDEMVTFIRDTASINKINYNHQIVSFKKSVLEKIIPNYYRQDLDEYVFGSINEINSFVEKEFRYIKTNNKFKENVLYNQYVSLNRYTYFKHLSLYVNSKQSPYSSSIWGVISDLGRTAATFALRSS